jgi:RimJ/RimL family protein N-acetyltransferase
MKAMSKMATEETRGATEDIWQGITRTSQQVPNGGSGVWMQHMQFENLMRENEAIWKEISSAFKSVRAKPRVFVGRRGEGIEFLLLHHTLSAELGLWLAPSQRGKGLATAWLKAGLVNIDWSLNPLLMATCPSLSSASARAFIKAGFRVLAEQEQQVILCFYRPQRSD